MAIDGRLAVLANEIKRKTPLAVFEVVAAIGVYCMKFVRLVKLMRLVRLVFVLVFFGCFGVAAGVNLNGASDIWLKAMAGDSR